ncbi:Ammonium transporter [hydrothermal vent metagenome]|uniref:Ammonium transporter n=1 Tax=hydrothermal vent metagenome TaxID=652676 RepID=A0A3B0TJJ5_9ZZZZ
MKRRMTVMTVVAAFAVIGPLASIAHAQETTSITEIGASLDAVWLFLAAVLVMFMQAGFALVEAGFTRAKNAGNIIMKNLMDFSVGGLAYWAFGFALAYGGSTVGGFIGYGDVWFFNDPSRAGEWFFQVVFAATAATIISGAVAGRVKFSAYLIYTPFFTGLIYPIVAHWVWGGGWLSSIGFFDFAGSGVVHMLGGVAALAGAIVVGPRIGKYTKDGRPRPIPGHSVTLGALGVFILWFGWYGFNAGSTLAAVGQDIATPAVVTTLGAFAGSVGAMFTAWFVTGKPDVGFSLNGVLAGLVGVTAGAASLSFPAAVGTGLVAGVIMVFSVSAIERSGIDDPVGAVSVHGAAGLWGLIAVGLFTADASLPIQMVGALVIIAWAFATSFAVFKVVDLVMGIRVSESEEIIGLDRSEHGGSAYPEFVFLEQLAEAHDLDPVDVEA